MDHGTHEAHRRRLRAAVSAVLLLTLVVTPPSAPAAIDGGVGAGSVSRVTICHATGSASNPWVQITIAPSGLEGHANHADDLIPAPEGGCPAAATDDDVAGGDDEQQAAPQDGATTGTGGTEIGSVAPLPPGPVAICRATGLPHLPYRLERLPASLVARARMRPADLVPAPAGGCPTLPTESGTSIARPCERERSTKSAVVMASGPQAVTLQSCSGAMVRIWGDPWVTTSGPGMPPTTFGVGAGSWSRTLPSGARIEWTTDPARHHALAWLRVTARDGSAATARPWGYVPTTGEQRIARVELTHADLVSLVSQLAACTGDTQAPLTCRTSAPSPLTPGWVHPAGGTLIPAPVRS